MRTGPITVEMESNIPFLAPQRYLNLHLVKKRENVPVSWKSPILIAAKQLEKADECINKNKTKTPQNSLC